MILKLKCLILAVLLAYELAALDLPPKPWDSSSSNPAFLNFFSSGAINGAFSLDEISSIMSQLVAQYPQKLRVESIGQSYEKREIKAYFFNSEPFEKGKTKSVLMMGKAWWCSPSRHPLQRARDLRTSALLLNEPAGRVRCAETSQIGRRDTSYYNSGIECRRAR